jgi:hypothetical protein
MLTSEGLYPRWTCLRELVLVADVTNAQKKQRYQTCKIRLALSLACILQIYQYILSFIYTLANHKMPPVCFTFLYTIQSVESSVCRFK